MITQTYIKDGTAIYERSFAIIRAEADLSGLSEAEADIAVRMIHACGQVEAAKHFVFSKDFAEAGRAALAAGAPILCDAEMVAHGVTRNRLPASNDVICTLRDSRTSDLAAKIGNTRSAAALELWRDRLEGAVVAIGNAPQRFDESGNLTDETSKKMIAQLLQNLLSKARQLRPELRQAA